MTLPTFAGRALTAGCEMTGTVKKGVFYVDDKRQLTQKVATLPDGPAVLRIAPASGARTMEDNRRYFGILREVERQSGNATKELHDYYKDKFNNGQSTALLDERTFRLYVDQVMGDAAGEWGVEFPVPEALI